MSVNKPLIFVTNDDGYSAKGIRSLVESLIGLGEIVVVAPDGPRSGMSSAITSIQPIRYHLVKKDEKNDITVYACTGTPVDCVKLGISEIVGRKPDLLVSGINHGSNASVCVLYSGTMGAAMEGALFKVPSIGFSLLDHALDADFAHTYPITRALSEDVLRTGLPAGVCLNVNIPHSDDELKGLKVCRQASGQWIEEFKRSEDGANKPIFWLTGRFDNDEPNDETTDEWALANGYASIVPITVDMTAHMFVEKMKSWEKLIYVSSES
ncbi:5'/3'-nucleotidase SurE [Dysgonomonas macrotermitis]|uniref:5'-nucleotidase SurE n=1 Tax=Dysgonomonas macrotermitis TaxID=1346286 RepID=A0A1M4U1L8_9BACT|nr:5'/3'-nucleotidase SurE [Dysgonomonas macrotermitis]SHE50550.1 5'-nucleotidase /3'-nucleotidase /exopolyphosphatase [Dysgonomonas macrotermitis]